jgi:non-homologous end joining protein Ku
MGLAISTRERIRCNIIINRATGNRVRSRQADAETGNQVPQEGRVKGYQFSYCYEDAFKELIEAKYAGNAPPTVPSSNVINLMDALRRSVWSEHSGASSRRGGKGCVQRSHQPARKPAAKGQRHKRAS